MGIIDSSSEDISPVLNRVTVSMYVIAFLVVALRFFTRGWIVRKSGLDDIFIAVAMVFGTLQTATILLQIKYGRGRHASTLSVEQYNKMLMCNWVNLLFYFLVNWALKMSILALYHRIGAGKKGLPWILRTSVIWGFAVILTAFTMAIFIAQIFNCWPISRFWDVNQTPRGCFNSFNFNLAQGSINVLTDLILLLYPLPLLRTLKINPRQRVALMIIFSIGAIPLAASVLRLVDISLTPMRMRPDVTWLEADTSWHWAWVPVWSEIEVDVGIVMASLPSLSPLLKKAWAGFPTGRTTKSSQIRELPRVCGSLGLQVLASKTHSGSSTENRKNLQGIAFFEEARVVEEGTVYEDVDQYSGIGIAKTTTAEEPVRCFLPPLEPHPCDLGLDGIGAQAQTPSRVAG